MELELCAGSYRSALIANDFPFKRIELCFSLSSGGLTPSAGTIVKVLKDVSAECHVLIRPRVGDFNYSDEEIEVMKSDIEFCKTVGCKGVVFGVLTEDRRFDLEKNLMLLDVCEGLETTFHRAIDDSLDFENDLESIINCGFNRVLTSGGKSSAEKGRVRLKRMRKITAGKIELMIGGGVSASNILDLKDEISPDAVHFSGTEKTISGENTLFEDLVMETSKSKVQNILNALNVK